ncbi:uncharacterized protein LOC112082079 [Eutrema salsugineum]|uniref:uncharacterized protein LOC112082079 n=1 Tax=Eutrema salsugineum TaxID=72664 RepID=UPI000CED4C75|nr:uncharacterized protein LOC112082079 [Eutrema salsugineum]
MSKAYDRLDWNFIKAVLLRFGFHQWWVDWVMQCVSTVSYVFLLNDGPQGQVLPTRRIRQGDPLSLSYLFFAAKCFQVSVLKLRQMGLSKDTMFSCNTNEGNTKALLDILQKYETASGQSINREKSSISLSQKTPAEIRERVKRNLQISKEGGVGNYLGRCKKDLFTGIIDEIRQKPSAVGGHNPEDQTQPTRCGGQRIWLRDKSGVYSTKSGYFAALEESSPSQFVNPLDWSSDICNISSAPKVKTFLWKAANGALPVGVALAKRIPSVSPDYRICQAPESSEHLLFLSPFAQKVWELVPFHPEPWSLNSEVLASKWKEARKSLCLGFTALNKGALTHGFAGTCGKLETTEL